MLKVNDSEWLDSNSALNQNFRKFEQKLTFRVSFELRLIFTQKKKMRKTTAFD